ncbi:MAG: SDR family oxidoreductase [Hyphomicrobiales bacterium]|nr:SDR family oxidoreductase [Hyphomicrobiales bacterium]
MNNAAPKIALITGAARRIGRAVALDLAACGWRIGLHYRSSLTEAEGVKRSIEALGGAATLLQADLSDIDAVRALPLQCADAFGAPALLVNNASLFAHDAFATMTPELWDAHLACNLKAPIFLSQAFAAVAPQGASIVHIIDQRVLRPDADFFSYTLSKAALFAATRMMAQALAPRLRVNAVGPGPVLQSIHQTPEEFAAEAAAAPLARAVDPAEIAAAVRFLVESPSITGQMIAVDAGQHVT